MRATTIGIEFYFAGFLCYWFVLSWEGYYFVVMFCHGRIQVEVAIAVRRMDFLRTKY